MVTTGDIITNCKFYIRILKAEIGDFNLNPL